jgi:hypothetical protein
MPERLRTLVNRLRRFVGERRHAARRAVRLPVSVSLAPRDNGSRASASTRALSGHTCDLSATGLGLILPAVRIGDRYLTGEGRTVYVMLELPEGSTVHLRAVPVRYERLDETEAGGENGFLVGMHILEMDAPDRTLFFDYVRELGRQ